MYKVGVLNTRSSAVQLNVVRRRVSRSICGVFCDAIATAKVVPLRLFGGHRLGTSCTTMSAPPNRYQASTLVERARRCCTIVVPLSTCYAIRNAPCRQTGSFALSIAQRLVLRTRLPWLPAGVNTGGFVHAKKREKRNGGFRTSNHLPTQVPAVARTLEPQSAS